MLTFLIELRSTVGRKALSTGTTKKGGNLQDMTVER